MASIEKLQKEVEDIKKRNERVEVDKAWETSFSRKIIISVLIYAGSAFLFIAASFPNPFVNSLIPACAFFLSTLTLPALKNIWIKHIYRK